MSPSPISIVRSLPHHLWQKLPPTATRRRSAARVASDRPTSVRPSSTNTKHPGDRSHMPLALPISKSMKQPTLQRARRRQMATLSGEDKEFTSFTHTVEGVSWPAAIGGEAEAVDGIAVDGLGEVEPVEIEGIPEEEYVPPVEHSSGRLTPSQCRIQRVQPERRAKIATLRKSLQKVLFNPGVHFIRDPRTGHRNFEFSLEDVPSKDDFAYHRCPSYISPSKDASLARLAEQNGAHFIGSTSSLTQSLSNFYFALSGGKGINLSTISMDFQDNRSDFTAGASLAASIILRPISDHPGVYAIDSDKSHDVENVLSDIGRVLEKVLTSEDQDFQRFLKSAPESAVPEKERTAPEAYSYCKSGSMLMRSQLDCWDRRLPGSGVFDIKTRACHPIRHDRANYEANSVYDISTDRGKGATFERELYDLARSGMLKYTMQARIGGMDGILCAFHNTKRLMGFQYLPLAEMDEILFGSSDIGDMAFRYSVSLFEATLKHITSKISDEPVAVIIRHTYGTANSVDVAFHPLGKPEETHGLRVAILNVVNQESVVGELVIDPELNPKRDWVVKYRLNSLSAKSTIKLLSSTQKIFDSMAVLSVPEGKTVEEMTAASAASRGAEMTDTGDARGQVQWKKADGYILGIRREAKKIGAEYEARKKGWRRIWAAARVIKEEEGTA